MTSLTFAGYFFGGILVGLIGYFPLRIASHWVAGLQGILYSGSAETWGWFAKSVFHFNAFLFAILPLIWFCNLFFRDNKFRQAIWTSGAVFGFCGFGAVIVYLAFQTGMFGNWPLFDLALFAIAGMVALITVVLNFVSGRSNG